MKLAQQLKIKQNQSLIMTPQLQQAIKLLQLTNIELTEFIDKAQMENPLLQEKKELSQNKLIDNENINPNICEKLNDTSDLLQKENKIDLENTFDSHLSSNANDENKKLYDREILKSGNIKSAGEVIEKTLKNKISLKEYLVNQINIEFKDKDYKEIAIGMVDYLHPSGWLTSKINEVEEDINERRDIIGKTHKKIKKREQDGIFNKKKCERVK